MARSRSGRFTKKRRSSKKVRRNGLTKRQRAARKAAKTRARRRAARSAAARRGRRRSSRRSVRAYPRRSRRGRRVGSVGRRASRRRRKPGGHFRSYRSLSRKYGPRKAARMWRRKRKYIRANPFTGWLPSMSGVKDIVKTGAVAYVGFVGVNAGLYGLDRIGLATLKQKIGSNLGIAAVNAAARIVLTGIVAKLGSKFLGMNGRDLALGGAVNVILHGVQDVVASSPNVVPDTLKPMLLGYDGFGDWVSLPGMSDWVSPGMNGMGILPEPIDPGTTLA